MGSFISSPQQRASEGLYNAAVSGQPIGAQALQNLTNTQITQSEQLTSNRIGGEAGDILARASSQGFAPGSGVEGIIGKATQGLLGSEQSAEAGIYANQSNDFMTMLLDQLKLGLAGLPASSPFGDIMTGLTSLTKTAAGAYGLFTGNPALITAGVGSGSSVKTGETMYGT